MEESKELKKIKKEYGERFMHLCRELFPTILEKEGTLYKLLSLMFAENCRKSLYEDLTKNRLEEKFKNYVYSKIDVEASEITILKEKTPYELLDEVGYDLFECTTEEEIQKFKKYYAKGEELCTFHGGRLDDCVVFFAVKKDAEKIKRDNFKNPKREDEYGTSVMGIQFNKHGICTVSIKNRYNHKVNNPDATYGNNLERIATGLTQSFAHLLEERDLNLNTSNIEKFNIPSYLIANDGKYYKYNMEVDQIYYCPGNVVIEFGQPEYLENPETRLLVDYFVVDTKNKTINSMTKDSFVEDLQDIEKIEIQKNIEKGNGARNIIVHKKNIEDPIVIEIDKDNQIIGYRNENLKEVNDSFLKYNNSLTTLELPNLERTGNNFLFYNNSLTSIDLPKLKEVENCFMFFNNSVNTINLPQLTKVGNKFLDDNNSLNELCLPNLEKAGDAFLNQNNSITHLELPKLTSLGNYCLFNNKELIELKLPNLKHVGKQFLCWNIDLYNLYLPKLESADFGFLYHNEGLKQLEVPNLNIVGDAFLNNNRKLMKLVAPNLMDIGNDFLHTNYDLNELSLLKLIEVGNRFLYENTKLSKLDAPNLVKVGDEFLNYNNSLVYLELLNLKEVGNCFLKSNRCLKQAYLPALQLGTSEYFLRL